MQVLLAVILLWSGFAHATPVRVLSHPSLLAQPGVLQPALELGRPGISLHTRHSRGLAPPQVSVAGAFPLGARDQVRQSGWIWGFRTGITGLVWETDQNFAASHYHWELALGRGTIEPKWENQSGLRGFLELSLRQERPRAAARLNDVAEELRSNMRDQKLFLGIKMGAASLHDTRGLVTQNPGPWFTSLITQLYLPLRNEEGPYLSVQGQVARRCGLAGLRCGLQLFYDRPDAPLQTSTYEEISEALGGGPHVAYTWNDYWDFSLEASWLAWLGRDHGSPWVAWHERRLLEMEGAPTLTLRVQAAFL